MESIRQRKMSALFRDAMSEVLRTKGPGLYGSSCLVSIVEVMVTPDLSIARFYISVFNHEFPEEVIHVLTEHTGELKGLLGNKLRNHVRKIPSIEFYKDDTIEHSQKMDQLFRSLKKDDSSEQE